LIDPARTLLARPVFHQAGSFELPACAKLAGTWRLIKICGSVFSILSIPMSLRMTTESGSLTVVVTINGFPPASRNVSLPSSVAGLPANLRNLVADALGNTSVAPVEVTVAALPRPPVAIAEPNQENSPWKAFGTFGAIDGDDAEPSDIVPGESEAHFDAQTFFERFREWIACHIGRRRALLEVHRSEISTLTPSTATARSIAASGVVMPQM
jgi:hypothetical protein